MRFEETAKWRETQCKRCSVQREGDEEGDTMRTIIAYVLVVLLVRFCSMIGGYIGFLPVALLLAWAPISLRTIVAGVCGGIAGVTFAVAFGYGIFCFMIGPESFTIGAFLASTLPLLPDIRFLLLHSRRVKALGQEYLETIANSHGDQATKNMAEETETAYDNSGIVGLMKTGYYSSYSGIVGLIVGLVMASVWFFWQ
jgi:hypothetical protein